MNPRGGAAVTFAVLGLALGCGGAKPHGTITSMSVASRSDYEECSHGVPCEVCVQCDPRRAARFKERGDWCSEHDVPESQCLKCHPDLDFSPPKQPPPKADVAKIGQQGADLPALEPHRVPGKITIFDFYAAWCPPCRKVDEHLYPKLGERQDIAIRKIDVGSWDTPVAERWLDDVPELPYLVIYAKNGRRIGAVAGANFAEIDRLIAEAGRAAKGRSPPARSGSAPPSRAPRCT
jgi:thiol-disulfide isomerase/thioredoxin